MTPLEIHLADEQATRTLGASLAAMLRKGDVVCLSGPLGAGKTTLARGVVEALADETPPSPTFALVETYETALGPLFHFDLYRLERARDAVELGLEDALSRGICLIEWPERIESLIPARALLVRLDPDGDGRKARFLGGGDWGERLRALPGSKESPQTKAMTNRLASRAEERADFLKTTGWATASAEPLAGDASTRAYERLRLDGKTALLMNAPPAAESAACPPEATPEERRALGYNAMARLAGPNLNAFLAIAAALRRAGLAAPEVHAADPARGFAVIEDFGDDLFARAAEKGADMDTLYAAAVDALLHLRAQRPRAEASRQYTMLTYDRTALEAEIGLVPDWYWPFRKGSPPSGEEREAYLKAFAPALDLLSAPAAMVLRDFHAENLLWMPQKSGVARVGLIDFQDGLIGCAAYDLVSLLEDARRDVDPELAERMIARYCAGASKLASFDEAAFRRDYAVLAAQRNAKILGIFARLALRDKKPKYEGLLPRVEGYFRKDLQRPELSEARKFFKNAFPELAA
jgi:tRNA threonylcarbamoyl adenosine modification protein YjeE